MKYVNTFRSTMLRTLLFTHNLLQTVNLPHTSDYLKTMYLGYSEVFEFEHDGIWHQIHLQVNQYHDDIKYCITYRENGKLRNHNISYVKRLYREACAHEGITPVEISPAKPLSQKRIEARKRKTIDALTCVIAIHQRMNTNELIVAPDTLEEQQEYCKSNSAINNFFYGGHRYYINQRTTCSRWKAYYQVHCYEDGQEIPMDIVAFKHMLSELVQSK